MRASLPEVDLFWGVGKHKELADAICALVGMQCGCAYSGARMLSTPKYSAYLRIADGCDNRCTYCAIPLIRGGRRSVPIESLLRKRRRLRQAELRSLR